ncbi:mechanosensitive ion channel family protein [Candidatus Nanosalina sp. VS9-1]|uniref:mechanosensitive ion channel family protein n=1 Tax=Candidatus Nanosalina sp. VS9-1 TaxID=3388566 RepID=UPI0039DFD09F
MFEVITSSFTGLLPEVSASTIVAGFAVLVAGHVLNKISNVAVEKAVERKGASKHATRSTKRLTAYVIYPLTFVAFLGVIGVPLTALSAAVGLIGLGLSFALQDVIANFISGILIMIYRPIEIGDQIAVGGEEGTVEDIQTRATKIKTYDGRQVIVPNSDLYSQQVINNTAYKNRRFNVVVGISYDDDIKKAKELAEEVLEEADSVESDPAPQVLVDELGGSSVNLKLRGWTDNRRANIVTGGSEVTQLIKDKYDEAGIDIPYPIRTVYMEE